MSETGPFYDRYPHWSRDGPAWWKTRAPPSTLCRKTAWSMRSGSICSATRWAGWWACIRPRSTRGLREWFRSADSPPCARTPPTRGTGGVARYSHERPLIPRLGFFIGHESQIPYDFHEVLGAIAPRPVLVLQPELDRDANVARRCRRRGAGQEGVLTLRRCRRAGAPSALGL